MACVRQIATGIELDVWVSPRASRAGLGPLRGDRLRAAVTAPPVDGAANDAVRELVAASLQVPRSAVEIVRGATGRNKSLRVSGEPTLLFTRASAFASAPSSASESK